MFLCVLIATSCEPPEQKQTAMEVEKKMGGTFSCWPLFSLPRITVQPGN